ncbi:MAG TPA: hypothetical protein VF170_16690 [Planctomycetaceae bacterium]
MPSDDAAARTSPTPDEVATAYHEAGHAVMALVHGRPVQRVSIKPDERWLGRCEFRKGRFGAYKDLLETEILIQLAGLAAEARHTGRYGWDEAAEDLDVVRSLLGSRGENDRRADRLERRYLDKAEHILDRPGLWLAVERIAAELLNRTTISGRAARHLVEEAAKTRRGR